MARPDHKYDEKIAAKLEALICYGVRHDDIASHIGMSINTLKKHYSDIFENCTECRHSKVKNALFYQATVLNIPASTIFYLKTQCSEEFGDKTNSNDITKNDLVSEIADHLPD